RAAQKLEGGRANIVERNIAYAKIGEREGDIADQRESALGANDVDQVSGCKRLAHHFELSQIEPIADAGERRRARADEPVDQPRRVAALGVFPTVAAPPTSGEMGLKHLLQIG